MNILAIIIVHIGAGCLLFANGLIMVGTLRMNTADMTTAQQQAFWLTGGGLLCFIWAVIILTGMLDSKREGK